MLVVRRESGSLAVIKRVRAGLEAREDLLIRIDQERLLLRSLGGRCGLVALDEPPLGDSRSITLRFLEGGTLRTALETNGRLDVDATMGVAGDVLGALGHLHSAGVIHRDVNATNVVFDAGGRAWLIDLSVAAFGSPPRGLPPEWEEERVGTLPYTAPEAILDPRATPHPTLDLFALGVTLWESFTGTRPFERAEDEPPDAFARRVLSSRLPDETILVRHAGTRIASAVLGLLERLPSMRPQSVAEVLDALGLSP